MLTRDQEIGETARALRAARTCWDETHRLLDSLAVLIKQYEDRLKELTKE